MVGTIWAYILGRLGLNSIAGGPVGSEETIYIEDVTPAIVYEVGIS